MHPGFRVRGGTFQRLWATLRRTVRTWIREALWRLQRNVRTVLTARTAQGLLSVSTNDDVIGKALYCSGEHEWAFSLEAAEFARARRAPGGGFTVLDIGAHVGAISIGLVLRGYADAAVAIEPDSLNFELLSRNVRQNGLEAAFVCMPFAVLDIAGPVSFELSPRNLGDHRVRLADACVTQQERYDESSRRVVQVQADTLDHLMQMVPPRVLADLGLIWIDVQGSEGRVFDGGQTVLAADVPVVAEVWPYGLRRAGTNPSQFSARVGKLWASYWVLRRGRLIGYPTAAFPSLLKEIGDEGGFENVIFTR